MNTNGLLQQALNELAVSAAKLNESAIRLRCAFVEESGKKEAMKAYWEAQQASFVMGTGAKKDCEQAAQSAQVARADLGKELDPLRDVSSEELDEFFAMFPSKTFPSYSDARIALNIFLAKRRRAS